MSTPYPTSDSPPRSGDNGLPAGTSSMSGSGSGYGSSASSYGTDDTVSRVKQGAHEAVDRLADKAAPAIERMKTSLSGMSDTMHARGEQLGEMQEQWMETCRTSVREHPLAAIGVAVVAGMVLSKLLSSSR